MSEERLYSNDEIDQMVSDAGFDDPHVNIKDRLDFRTRLVQQGGPQTGVVIPGFESSDKARLGRRGPSVFDYARSQFRIVDVKDQPLSGGSQQIVKDMIRQRENLKVDIQRELRDLQKTRTDGYKMQKMQARLRHDSKEEMAELKQEYEAQTPREKELEARLLNLMLLDDSQLELAARAMRAGATVLSDNLMMKEVLEQQSYRCVTPIDLVKEMDKNGLIDRDQKGELAVAFGDAQVKALEERVDSKEFEKSNNLKNNKDRRQLVQRVMDRKKEMIKGMQRGEWFREF